MCALGQAVVRELSACRAAWLMPHLYLFEYPFIVSYHLCCKYSIFTHIWTILDEYRYCIISIHGAYEQSSTIFVQTSLGRRVPSHVADIFECCAEDQKLSIPVLVKKPKVAKPLGVFAFRRPFRRWLIAQKLPSGNLT